MTAKQYLGETKTITRRILAMEKRRVEYARKAQGERMTPQEAGAYLDIEQDLIREVELLRDRQRETSAMIGEMEDERHKLILEERYLNGYMFQRIARDAGYSYDHTIRLHRQALAAFGKIYKAWHIAAP